MLPLVPSSERNSFNSQGCSALNLEEGNKLLHGGTLETFILDTIQQFSDQFMFVVCLLFDIDFLFGILYTYLP